LSHDESIEIQRTISLPLNESRASAPSMPFSCVANASLCQALMFSRRIHAGKAVVSGQAEPAAYSFSMLAGISYHVRGAWRGSSFAFRNASRL
jgi:hypothetical protein